MNISHYTCQKTHTYIYIVYIYITAIETDLTCAVEKLSTRTLFKRSLRFKEVFSIMAVLGTLAVYWSQEINIKQAQVVVLK